MLEEITSAGLGEKYYKYTHSSGVTVLLYPMKGYSTVTAQFSVKFGSIDNCYSIDGGAPVHIPDGTAHYLEHKLFEAPEKEAFARFAETGASCNAGTSYDSTRYYFSCSENFEKNLEILLDFVQHPYFTPENVEKERGIITQEITMYLDNPGWRVCMELYKGMFSRNPVQKDIAGSPESIALITDKLLYDVYNAFYDPSNMYLCIAGGFDLESAVEVCERCLLPRSAQNVVSIMEQEPPEVVSRRVQTAMPLGKTNFALGFKMPAYSGRDMTEEYIYHTLMNDTSVGASTEFYRTMRDKGLINETFESSIMMGRGFFIPGIYGESDEPDRVAEEVCAEYRRLKGCPPSEEAFLRAKKYLYGDSVRSYNNVESVAQNLSDAALTGTSAFDYAELAAAADYEGMLKRLSGFDENSCCLSVIVPTED